MNVFASVCLFVSDEGHIVLCMMTGAADSVGSVVG